MRSRVRFPVLSWGFFLEEEGSHSDHGLGSLVELRFKAPPGTSYSYITIHLIVTLLDFRSRLHFVHNREWRPRSPYGTCGGIGGILAILQMHALGSRCPLCYNSIMTS
jgi:hypothetical protein